MKKWILSKFRRVKRLPGIKQVVKKSPSMQRAFAKAWEAEQDLAVAEKWNEFLES